MTPPLPQPNEGLNAAVAAELRAEQGRQKISVQALAELADVPYGTLRRYLNAERYIDLAVIDQICRALGVHTVDVIAAGAAAVERQRNDDLAGRRSQRRPELYSFDEAEAARDEDRENPRMGDE